MKNVFLILSICILSIYGCSSSSGTDKEQDSLVDTKAKTENSNISNPINIDKESSKDNFCYVNKVFESDKKYYIAVDYIIFLRGKEAEAEAKKRGQPFMDDYIIVNDNQKLRTFLVSENVHITLIDYTDNIQFVPGKTINDLKNKDTSLGICKIDVADGVVMKIEEIYTP